MSIDSVALRSPDALLASLPYLIGFTPADSVVVVWLRGSAIVLTQRIDWPIGSDPAAWQEALVAPAATTDADEVVVVLVRGSDGAEFDPVSARLVGAWVQDAFRLAPLPVRDLLHLDEGRWRSLMCADDACCPAVGRVLDDGVQLAVAAEFAAAGHAPLAARADVVASLAPDAATKDRLDGRVARARPPRADREAWRDRTIESFVDAVDQAPDSARDDRTSARAIAGLGDIRVRDTILWELTRRDGDALGRALALLITALRGCPPADVPGVATTLAVVAWLLGDGARAMIAIERALVADPHYSLAHLVQRSVSSGLPPRAWVEAMSGLSRRACRHGH